ncbi:MAG: response regulator [Sphingobacterium sp.]|nr:response regulator [Sphingobacterium sp.]
MNSDKEKAYGAGCSGFIAKPIDVCNFAVTIEKHLKTSKNSLYKPEQSSCSYNYSINNPINKTLFKEKDSINPKWHKILIVDDNYMNAELLKETLDQIGKTSVIAYNAKKALSLIESEDFDLILLDIMMPRDERL